MVCIIVYLSKYYEIIRIKLDSTDREDLFTNAYCSYSFCCWEKSFFIRQFYGDKYIGNIDVVCPSSYLDVTFIIISKLDSESDDL